MMPLQTERDTRTIAVVIPCYRVRRHIVGLIARIGPEIDFIFVVDDACPEGSGDVVERGCNDARVRVIRNAENMGVGGATMQGYRAAMAVGAAVIVKIDGDGQMDPAQLPRFVRPILAGQADYTKGNRFFDLTELGRMPIARVAGNAALSLMAKISTGYWSIFDPTNGYTAINTAVAAALPLDRISKRYFFETDVLFRLNTIKAVVVDVPMHASYGDEKSNLVIRKVILDFMAKHLRNTLKRIFYNYFLRDMSLASLELLAGIALILFGTIFGGVQWGHAASLSEVTPAGTVMLAALPIILGVQLLLAFLAFDIAAVPVRPIGALLAEGTWDDNMNLRVPT